MSKDHRKQIEELTNSFRNARNRRDTTLKQSITRATTYLYELGHTNSEIDFIVDVARIASRHACSTEAE